MKQKLLVLTVILLAVFGPVGYREIKDSIYQRRLDHYDELYDLYQQQSEMMATDGLLIKNTYDDYSYNYSESYLFINEFGSIDFNVRQQYREMMMECGIAENEVKYCSIDDIKGAYSFYSVDDMYRIEVYYEDSLGLQYLMSEFIPNQSIKLFQGTIDEAGEMVSGDLFLYDKSGTILYYDIHDKQINLYNEFAVDGTVDFLYRRYHSLISVEQYIRFWDDDRQVVYEFGQKLSSNNLFYHKLHFYNNNNEYISNVEYNNTNISTLFWKSEYVEGWNDFYSTNCLKDSNEILSLYHGICASSDEELIFVHLEDYPNVSLDQLLSLQYFGLSYDEVSLAQLNDAEAYFQNHYNDLEQLYDFNYETLETTDYQLDSLINPTIEVVKILTD